MEKTKVHLLGVEKGNGTTLTRQHDPSKIETQPVSDISSYVKIMHMSNTISSFSVLKLSI